MSSFVLYSWWKIFWEKVNYFLIAKHFSASRLVRKKDLSQAGAVEWGTPNGMIRDQRKR